MSRKFSCVKDENKKYPCDYCDAVFSHRQSKSVHIKLSCKKKPLSKNNFGSESLDHLPHEFLTFCVMSCNKGIRNLLQEIHYNQDVQENNNIRISSVKRKLLEKFVDGRWVVCDQNNTLDEMIKNGYRILFKHLAQLNASDEEAIMRNETANSYLMKLVRKENVYFDLRRDIYTMILAQHQNPIAKLGL
jgi:hypothetical protein